MTLCGYGVNGRAAMVFRNQNRSKVYGIVQALDDAFDGSARRGPLFARSTSGSTHFGRDCRNSGLMVPHRLIFPAKVYEFVQIDWLGGRRFQYLHNQIHHTPESLAK